MSEAKVISVKDMKTTGEFAYEGCHKIYVLESEKDRLEAVEYDYEILDMDLLERTYRSSCSLKFVSNWSLDKRYIEQCEDVVFV